MLPFFQKKLPHAAEPSAASLAAQVDAPADAGRGGSPWRDAWRRLRQNKLAVLGGATLAVIAVVCVAGPWFSGYTYQGIDLNDTFAPPSAAHWMGTDQLGHDLFVRLLYGGRISLAVGLVATLVALTIGVAYGAVAGWAGGKVDAFMMRVVDIIYALPFTIFVILLMVFLGRSLWLLFLAIGAVEWLTMARIVRGQIMALKRAEYVEAARTLGYGTARIIFRHMLPNILGPVVVYTTLTIPGVMMLEAFLSFLGLGVQDPMSSWGVLIHDGSQSMETYPWLLAFPGAVFSLTLFSLNFLGDGLRDALDVRSAKD